MPSCRSLRYTYKQEVCNSATPISTITAECMMIYRHHTLVLVQSTGRVYSFGLGSKGQLGTGRSQNSLQPVQVAWSNGGKQDQDCCKIFSGGDQSFLVLTSNVCIMLVAILNIRGFRMMMLASCHSINNHSSCHMNTLNKWLQLLCSQTQFQI